MKTSYYTHAASLDRNKFFLVRISVGSPRFLKCDSVVNFLAPEREWFELSKASYDKKYIAKLNKIGVEAIKSEFTKLRKIAGKREIVLLCYESLSPEKVAEGQCCHRKTFVKWWEQKTGEKIAEISPHHQVQIQQTLL